MLESLIISALLTIVLELMLSLIIGIRGQKNIESVICINIITNPIVVSITNLAYMLSNDLTVRNIVLVTLEIIVIFVEGFFFKRTVKNLKIKSYIYSAYLNILSFSIGMIINLIIK